MMNEEKMKRRAVWRWKSFWLVVCVLCFLGWAWVRSMMWADEVNWHHLAKGAPMADGRGISVQHFGGEVRILWEYEPSAVKGLSHWCVPSKNFTGLDPAETFTRVIESGAGLRGAAVVVKDSEVRASHWFVALVFLLAWGSWLVWRWRRERKNVWTGMDRMDGIGER